MGVENRTITVRRSLLAGGSARSIVSDHSSEDLYWNDPELAACRDRAEWLDQSVAGTTQGRDLFLMICFWVSPRGRSRSPKDPYLRIDRPRPQCRDEWSTLNGINRNT